MLTTKRNTKHAAHAKKEHPENTNNVSITSWTIVNNAGIDIVVINTFKENDDDSVELYEQSLQTLVTNDNKKFIAKATSAIVTIGSSQKTNNLIIAKAINLAPVKVLLPPAVGVSEVSVTLTAADLAIALQGETFEQSIVAFPSSSLAKGYADALSGGDPTTIDSFIQSQDGYENVTADIVLAYQTYYSRFPFAYAAYKADQSYYCYSSDGSKITYEGSLEIFNDNSSPVDTAIALSKFTTIFTNKTESDDINLYYSNGQFSDDLDASTPAICLTGIFVQRSQLTKIDTDKGLMPTFSGTVNGKSVLVYDQKCTEDKNGKYEGFDALLHPETAGDWISLGLSIAAAIGAITLLALVTKALVDKIRESNLTPEQIAAEKLTLVEAYRVRTQATLDRIGKRLKIPSDVNASLDIIKAEGNNMLLADNQRKMLDTLDQQQSCYETMLEFTDSDKMDQAYDNISEVYDVVRGAAPADLASQMPGLTNKIKETTGILNEVYKGITDKSFDQYKAAISEAQKNIDRNTSALDKNEDIREDLNNDDIPDIDIVE